MRTYGRPRVTDPVFSLLPPAIQFAAACVASLALLMGPAARTATADCDSNFLPRQDLGLLESNELDEASGLAASGRNPGVFWTHNDSGDPNRIFALGDHGQHLGVYTIAGVTNRDWEDIAVGPGPETGRCYIYIGEIGDNDAVYGTKYIYRVPEPLVDTLLPPHDSTLSGAVTIALQYPDGPRDAETLMIDPPTRDLYVVSKRESAVHVYRAPFPQPIGSAITLEFVATLPLTSVVAGDISPSGDQILLKTYTQVLHWCRGPGQTVAEALAAAPTDLPYAAEPQGEAIAWGADELSYYTTSEEPTGIAAHLYRYPHSTAGGGDEPRGHTGIGGPFAIPVPNPFRREMEIRYVLLHPTEVRLLLCSASGQCVRTLVGGWQEAGVQAIRWDGRDETGRAVPAGAYYYTIRSSEGALSGHVVNVR